MVDVENLNTWQAVLVGVASAVLVLLGRVSGTRKTFRKDGAEGDLFTQLSTALKASEDRRAEEAEAHRAREAAHEQRHQQNMERLLELTRQVSRMEGTLQTMERQYADVVNQLQRSDATNKMLVQELGEYRQLFLQRLAELLPTPAQLPPAAPAPGMPPIITKA